MHVLCRDVICTWRGCGSGGSCGPSAASVVGEDIPGALPALKPCVLPAGPFISVVLSKLENMLENSLHVNLLLIGIITQLASYPQPLLRSFLLNTNMVFQPSVRSLYQVREATSMPVRFMGAKEQGSLCSALVIVVFFRNLSLLIHSISLPVLFC